MKPGTTVPFSGMYRCIYCGPGRVTAAAAKCFGVGPAFLREVQTSEKIICFFAEGTRFGSCPNCCALLPGEDLTIWVLEKKTKRDLTRRCAGCNKELKDGTYCWSCGKDNRCWLIRHISRYMAGGFPRLRTFRMHTVPVITKILVVATPLVVSVLGHMVFEWSMGWSVLAAILVAVLAFVLGATTGCPNCFLPFVWSKPTSSNWSCVDGGSCSVCLHTIGHWEDPGA